MKTRSKTPTLADLSPKSRAFWKERGLLDRLPIGLLVALDRELEQEARGWREQIEREFGGTSAKRNGR